MDEYRKIINVHSLILYKEDLLDLEDIIKQDMGVQDDLKIILDVDSQRITANSFEDLFKRKIPKRTNNLSINIHSWNQEKEIDKGIHMRFYHNYIDYQIHSYNEIWFLGKVEKLNAFFLKHKPWYLILKKALPFLLGVLSVSSVISLLKSIKQKNLILIILSSVSLFIVFVLEYLDIKQKIFPFTVINFYSRNYKKLNAENVTVLIGILTLILTTIGSIILPLLMN